MIDIAKLETLAKKYGINTPIIKEQWESPLHSQRLIILVPDQQRISTTKWSYLVDKDFGWEQYTLDHRTILLKLSNLEVIYDSLK